MPGGHDASFSVTGAVSRAEFAEAVKAAGTFRWARVAAVLGTVWFAAAGITLDADGVTVHPAPLVIAAAYAVVMLVVLPRLLVRLSHARRAAAEKHTVVDDAGITVSRGGETMRMTWDEVRWYHDTPGTHVLVGRSGRRTCLLVLPKRLFTGPGESDLFGAFAHARAGDRG
ncbi:YcxB family protein [Streptomyces sp. NPDC101118]|uniref:YcxB family protein n=1 Tax=Streptomyces sp. NPDC101118 TaxID=3366109 RepID=UPI00382DCE07